jgi:L-ascorbate metabolism protein UlaG (beta-lactamase superfamily)
MRLSLKVITIILFGVAIQLHAQDKSSESIKFVPIQHSTMVIKTTQATIFVDPVGDIKQFKDFSPTIILITDIHGDHLDAGAVTSLKKKNTKIIGPKAVIEQLKEGQILNNGKTTKVGDIIIEAIPMYNLTEERLKFHEKGRGNGYVITADKKRIYISGDTEDIAEMRQLKNIDYAFVCMNLPYTMTVDQAASAVLEMKPKVVLPFHYRGKGGFSDVDIFKELVSQDNTIEVRILNWYK